MTGFGTAVNTCANVFRVFAKGHAHTLVKDVALAFPEAVVSKFLAVFDDAAVQVVNILEAFVLHVGAQILTADIARTIGQDGLVFW